MSTIKDQFFEDHEANISFFYTGRQNVIGMSYPDAVINNDRNAHYICIGTITYDSSLQYSEESVIDETFGLRIENNVSAQYAANSVTVKLIGHVTGKRVTKDKFKCIVTPEIEYMDIPEIMITEEEYKSNNIQEYKLGIWLHTETVKRIYTTKISSHSRNSSPLNSDYIDSRYYFDLLTNSNMVYDVDTTNISSTVTSKQFASGVSIYKPIDTRLTNLEAIRYPDIRFATVNFDLSWVPESTGSIATGYQKVPPVNADYGISMSQSFLRVQSGDLKGVTVIEDGLYSVQIVSGFNTLSAIKDSDIELSLFKNNDIVQGSSLIYKLKADKGETRYANPVGLSAPTTLLYLTSSDIIRLQFKFLTPAQNGVVNNGTRLQIMKMVQIP